MMRRSLWPNQALEVAIIGRQVGLGRVDKRQRLVEAGYAKAALDDATVGECMKAKGYTVQLETK
jgi:hypothetical protein